MLYEYLVENYQPNEPIFMTDIELSVSANYLRQMFKGLCDEGKIKRFDKGVYYIPGNSRLKGGTGISASTVLSYKYIKRKNQMIGYVSGYTFANQLGITMQVPYQLEVVSNNASANSREVNVKGQKCILRKAKTRINDENYRVLQFLDLLKDIDNYADDGIENVSGILREYLKSMKIKKAIFDQYITLYPDKTYRYLYEMGLYDVFA